MRLFNVGVIYGLAAYIWWAFSVFYFKAVTHVFVSEVLAHRIIWSSVLLMGILCIRRRLNLAVHIFHDVRTLSIIIFTALLLGFAWYLMVWAVVNDCIVQISLGYFIYPIINALLGAIILKEKLRSPQIVAILLVTLAVIVLGFNYGEITGIAIAFAVSFSLYGLLHKKIPVDPIVALTLESSILLPIALAYLVCLGNGGELAFFGIDITTDLLLIAAGLITALPLIWFLNALKRISYCSLGMMMYIMPSITLLIAIFVFQEPFHVKHLLSFILIWIALVIYSIHSVKSAT